jgi:hypothetical protein
LVVLLAATVVLALCGMAFAGGKHIQTITSQVQRYSVTHREPIRARSWLPSGWRHDGAHYFL